MSIKILTNSVENNKYLKIISGKQLFRPDLYVNGKLALPVRKEK
jgi:hypothetical protein